MKTKNNFKLMMFIQVIVLLLSIGLLGTSCKSTQDAASNAEEKIEVAKASKGINAVGKISFAAANDRYKAHGSFASWKVVSFDLPEGDWTQLKTVLEIDMGSVQEKSQGLADHLKASDFFFIDDFPKAMVTISDVKAMKNDQYMGTATINIRGIESKSDVKFRVQHEKPYHITGFSTVAREEHEIGVEYDNVTKKVEVNFDVKITAE